MNGDPKRDTMMSNELQQLGIDDTKGSDQAVNQNPQQRGGGRKGKKRQKWKKLDVDSIPDSSPKQYDYQGSAQPMQGKGAWNKSHQGAHSGHQSNFQQSRSQPRAWGYQGESTASNYQQRQDFAHEAANVPRSRDDDVALSKALVRLLRHGNPRDIPLDDEGYALIEQILMHHVFKRFNTSAREIKSLVDRNDKKRFEIVENSESKPYKIRATQGHSLKIKDLGLVLITDPKKHGVVLHGTYKTNWKKIKTEGLKRFQRAHIHFAIGHIGETHVTSGMRNTCDVIVYLDMAKAIKDGLKFYESSNNVVLSEGDENGAILPKYFLKCTEWDYKNDHFKPMAWQGPD